MRIVILGFGREGKSLLRFLEKNSNKDAEVWILDKNKSLTLPKGTRGMRGPHYLQNLERYDLVYRSPGIPYMLPELVRARRKGVRFSSATKLFFEECPCPIIGVTGTKGKGTTSTLIYKILKAAGRDVHLAGNIGVPALELLPCLRKKSLVVLELSSFQLQDLTASPHIAVVLDLFPDHQDSHGSLKEYYDAKASIARFQKKNDFIFYFSRNRLSAALAQKSPAKKISVDEKQFTLFGPQDLTLRGARHFKNAAMAATVAKSLDVPTKLIARVAATYKGLEHRLELVRTVRTGKGNLSFYNDSASTNPHTAAAAVEAFQKTPHILIAGGQDKNLDYMPLAKTLAHSPRTVEVILMGENKGKIRKALRGAGVTIISAATLDSALIRATRDMRRILRKAPLCAILFSPGATSFDMFRNYADRGTQFKNKVGKLVV